MQSLEMVIGRVVAARRKRLGLSQEALAEGTGLHPTYIGLIERGLRCPSARVILALGEGLGTKGSTLLAAIERELSRPEPAKLTKKQRVPRKGGTR
jgi:transcriptional regulator with XRE-family HTH domain